MAIVRWGRDLLRGMLLVHQGKVRDTYALDNPNLLLVVASDRLSIFDFVLNAVVPGKGAVLTALNIFWRLHYGDLCPHDLVAYGSRIDSYLPRRLRGNRDLQTRAVVVHKAEMCPIEAVVRGWLTGSGWKAYQESRALCGHRLPSGLQEGSELFNPIFTPTTKAAVGHDEPITVQSVREQYGHEMETRALQLYDLAQRFAKTRGLIIADTKFEFGKVGQRNYGLVLCDEVLTPDSSRIWKIEDHTAMRAGGPLPTGYDKQPVRDWGKERGVHTRDPADPEDYGYVRSLAVPPALLAETSARYAALVPMLTDMCLEDFQQMVMRVTA